MTTPIDLRADHLRIVQDVLARHLPDGVRVWVFGSRATWATKDSSDLDLALEGDGEIPPRSLSALEAAFEDSDLPFAVDVVDAKRLGERFRRIVTEQRVPLLLFPATATMRGRADGRAETSSTDVSSGAREEWATVRLGDVADLLTGFPFRSERYVFDSDAPRLLRGDNIAQGRLRWHGAKRWSAEAAAEMEQFWLSEGDVVLAMDRPWIEAGLKFASVQRSDLPALLVQRVARLRGGEDLDTRFLRYVIGCRDFSNYVLSVQTGTAVPHISARQIGDYEFHLPPLRHQRTVARILGGLDDKIELNRRMNATLEAMARALFKSWFVDFDPARAKMEGRDTGLTKGVDDMFPDRLVDSELGEIPEGWVVKTLGDLCYKPQYGYTASARSEPVGPRFLRITDINKESWVSWSRVPYCEATDDDLSRYRLAKGDVLIARMADPGHGVLVEEDVEAVFASYLIRLRPFEDRNGRLLQYWLRSDAYWELVRGQAAGTTRVSLNARVLSLFPMVLPPDGLASAFATVAGALRERLVQNATELQVLSELRDALLPKLISGELQVRDAEMLGGAIA